MDAMAVSFDKRQSMKWKREEGSKPSIHDSHEEGLHRSGEGNKTEPRRQPFESEFQLLQPYYEEASKHKEKWKLEECCKELEKKCDDLYKQKQVLQIVHDKFK